MSIPINITNGTVRVEDGVRKNEEYAPPRKVAVELSFAVEEGSDARAALDYVGQVASQQVAHLLGKAVNPVTAPAPKAEPVLDQKTGDIKPEAKKATTKKAEAPKADAPTGRTKADLEAEMIAEISNPAPAPEIEATDDLSDLLGDTAPKPVTDKEISDACIAKAEKMSKVAGWEPKKIRLLVEKFVGSAGAKFAQVPAAKRHEFLKELDTLK